MMSISISPDAATLMRDAARQILALSRAAIDAHNVFHIALSGGNTPNALFGLMASPEYAAQFDWAHIHLWWSDERYVPLESPELNYNMANDALIRHVRIPPANVHRTPVEHPATEAAEDYEAEIVRTLGASLPGFDVILLGLGDDGHTASCFPGTLGALPPDRLVAAHFVPKVKMWRITFTPRLLNAAQHVIFLVSGTGKAAILERVLHGPYQPDVLPAQIVAPQHGDLTWMIDAAAAAGLSNHNEARS
ncbi:MAG TPA: 6-phosphogluconolactonase [Anaerolineae bacterium]|jgi:6-phosphogluconolactonase